MRALLRALVVAALVAGGAPPASAAPPQITDPAGDARVPAAEVDVVSARFSTTGVRTRAGRRGVYTPTALVVTVTYAGAATGDESYARAVTFAGGPCRWAYLVVLAGDAHGHADCGAGVTEVAFDVTLEGARLTLSVPFKALRAGYRFKGHALTALRTYTAFALPEGYEPVFLAEEMERTWRGNGVDRSFGDAGASAIDVAVGTRPWVVA